MPAPRLDINLLAQTNINAKPLGKFLKWSLTYGRYIIIGTQIIVLLAFFSRFKLDQDLSDLHTKINEKVNILEALAPIENNTRLLQEKLKVLAQLEVNRQQYLTILNLLSQYSANKVIISQIIFNEKQLLINGKSTSNQGFGTFLNSIRQDKHFSQITLEEINRNNLDNTLTFKLSMQIQEPGVKPPNKITMLTN